MKKLLDKKIVMGLLILPLLEPSGTEDMSTFVGGIWQSVHLVFIVLKWISFLIIALNAIKQFYKPTKILWLITAYQFYLVFISHFNGELNFTRLSLAVTAIGTGLLFDYYIRYSNAKKFLEVVTHILEILIIINFVTLCIYPKGLYIDNRNWWQNWFLGYKNRHIYYFLPYLCIASIVDFIRYKKISVKFNIILAITVVSALRSDSKTSLVAIMAFVFFTLIFRNQFISKWFNLLDIYVISFITSMLIIFMDIQSKFEYIIVNILGKDLTMHARTFIWARAINDFFRHPFLGNGITDYDDLFTTWKVTQFHNMFLDIFVIGGIVLFSIFTITIYFVNNRVNKCSNTVICNITTFVFIGYALLFITEGRRDMALIYMYFVTCYYLPDIASKYNIGETVKRNKIKIRFRSKS